MNQTAKILILNSLVIFFIGCAATSGKNESTIIYNDETSVLSTIPGAVQSSHRENIKTLYWDKITTDKKSITGYWQGVTFKGKTVTYHFGADGKCDWTIGRKNIKGNYELQEEKKLYRIRMNNFNKRNLKEVELHGIIKFKGDEMIFYGIPVKNINELSRLPHSFSGNSLLLKRINRLPG